MALSFLGVEDFPSLHILLSLKQNWISLHHTFYKYLKEQGFEFEISENYGEPLTKGTYKVKHDIYNLDGDIVINIDESIEFNGEVDTIMGYDVFKYNDVYLTTEDLYA